MTLAAWANWLVGLLLAAAPLGEASPVKLDGTAEHGMEIVSVVSRPEALIVTTTGGVFEIGPASVALSRRIDPDTNDVAPRLVARLEFDQPAGEWKVERASQRSVVVTAGSIALDIRSDSLAFLANRSETESYAYSYRSTLDRPAWSPGRGLDRMWTDGGGGSLHLTVPGKPAEAAGDAPSGMKVRLSPGSHTALAVFPPKRFDFERLYGAKSRPHCYFTYTPKSLDRDRQSLDLLSARRFGVICLFEGLYSNAPEFGGRGGYAPERGDSSGGLEYRYHDPAAVDKFVNEAHRQGFKVITYLQGGQFSRQPVDQTLAFMRNFQKQHHLDGWYFDNAGIGNWPATYDFIRQVRADVGEEGVIYHHDSVDVWGGWSGLVMVTIDAYVNYTLKGETGTLSETAGPNDPYLAYYTGGYGLSQAMCCHKVQSQGRAALTLGESLRVCGENLHGSARASDWMLPIANKNAVWDQSFAPGHEARRREYLSGQFSPRLRWPADWYAEASNVQATPVAPDAVTITWETAEPAGGEIRYTTAARRNFDDQKTSQTAPPATRHAVTLKKLEPGTEYCFAVRSETSGPPGQRRVWGHVGKFTATAPTTPSTTPAAPPATAAPPPIEPPKTTAAPPPATTKPSATTSPAPVGRIEKCTYTSRIDGAMIEYALWYPPGYTDAAPWPLIVFLHGSGEGTAWNAPTSPAAGIPVRTVQSDLPYLVVFPLLRGSWSIDGPAEVDVLDTIEDVCQRARVDRDRIHLTGISMGGFAGWALAEHYPHLFATLSVFAGGGDPELVRNLRHIPTRVFHGTADVNVPIAESRRMVEAMQAADLDVSFTPMPGVTHACWTGPYASDEFYNWLAQKRRPDAPQRITYRTGRLRYHQAYWASIESVLDPATDADIDVFVPSPTEVFVHQTNVGRLVLNPPPTLVPTDGQPRFTVNEQPVTAERTERGWVLNLAEPDEAKLHKRPGLSGPIQDAFHDSFVIVTPAAPSIWPQVAQAAFEWRKGMTFQNFRFLTDTEVTDEVLRSANLICFGSADQNKVLARAAGQLPLALADGRLTHQGQPLLDQVAALIMIYPNPLNPDRYLVVCSGAPQPVAQLVATRLRPPFLAPPPHEDLIVVTADGRFPLAPPTATPDPIPGTAAAPPAAPAPPGAPVPPGTPASARWMASEPPALGAVFDRFWQLPPDALRRLGASPPASPTAPRPGG